MSSLHHHGPGGLAACARPPHTQTRHCRCPPPAAPAPHVTPPLPASLALLSSHLTPALARCPGPASRSLRPRRRLWASAICRPLPTHPCAVSASASFVLRTPTRTSALAPLAHAEALAVQLAASTPPLIGRLAHAPRRRSVRRPLLPRLVNVSASLHRPRSPGATACTFLPALTSSLADRRLTTTVARITKTPPRASRSDNPTYARALPVPPFAPPALPTAAQRGSVKPHDAPSSPSTPSATPRPLRSPNVPHSRVGPAAAVYRRAACPAFALSPTPPSPRFSIAIHPLAARVRGRARRPCTRPVRPCAAPLALPLRIRKPLRRPLISACTRPRPAPSPSPAPEHAAIGATTPLHCDDSRLPPLGKRAPAHPDIRRCMRENELHREHAVVGRCPVRLSAALLAFWRCPRVEAVPPAFSSPIGRPLCCRACVRASYIRRAARIRIRKAFAPPAAAALSPPHLVPAARDALLPSPHLPRTRRGTSLLRPYLRQLSPRRFALRPASPFAPRHAPRVLRARPRALCLHRSGLLRPPACPVGRAPVPRVQTRPRIRGSMCTRGSGIAATSPPRPRLLLPMHAAPPPLSLAIQHSTSADEALSSFPFALTHVSEEPPPTRPRRRPRSPQRPPARRPHGRRIARRVDARPSLNARPRRPRSTPVLAATPSPRPHTRSRSALGIARAQRSDTARLPCERGSGFEAGMCAYVVPDGDPRQVTLAAPPMTAAVLKLARVALRRPSAPSSNAHGAIRAAAAAAAGQSSPRALATTQGSSLSTARSPPAQVPLHAPESRPRDKSAPVFRLATPFVVTGGFRLQVPSARRVARSGSRDKSPARDSCDSRPALRVIYRCSRGKMRFRWGTEPPRRNRREPAARSTSACKPQIPRLLIALIPFAIDSHPLNYARIAQFCRLSVTLSNALFDIAGVRGAQAQQRLLGVPYIDRPRVDIRYNRVLCHLLEITSPARFDVLRDSMQRRRGVGKENHNRRRESQQRLHSLDRRGGSRPVRFPPIPRQSISLPLGGPDRFIRHRTLRARQCPSLRLSSILPCARSLHLTRAQSRAARPSPPLYSRL
ncbi:hypothetical protein B0H15DRAFT_1027190 [Mycena belliarum]|uniref:Uncharacterized protein n=1 Tax=Mycena belliarum TaxID=1033014 RepID=A0AAD6XHD4_9AGAR|nr:hypothetical protein B0H15DRAFT_1027190 [Mycena belliae]